METQGTKKKVHLHQGAALKPANATKPKRPKTTGTRKGRTGRSILNEELIAERAWHIWDQRGRKPGNDEENWFEAIDQLREETNRN